MANQGDTYTTEAIACGLSDVATESGDAEGFVLVPKQATKAMLDAAYAAHDAYEASEGLAGWGGLGSVYKAMIAAAPSHPGEADLPDDEEPSQTHIPFDEMSPEGKAALGAIIRAAKTMLPREADRVGLGELERLSAAATPGEWPKLKAAKLGTFNHPDRNAPGVRLIGWKVPIKYAGISGALFALERIEAELDAAHAAVPAMPPTTDLAACFEAKREECLKLEREAGNPTGRQYWRGRSYGFAVARDMARAGAAGGAGEAGEGSLEAQAREMLAAEYEAYVGEGPYPTYAKLARSSYGSFTQCSIRAIAKALAAAPPPPAQQGSSSPPLTVERVDLGGLERLSAEATQGVWMHKAFITGNGAEFWEDRELTTDGVEEFSSSLSLADAGFIVALVNSFRAGHLVPASLPAGTGSAEEGTGEDASDERANALKDCAEAVAFFDQVKRASPAEQVAVGSDHWNWLEKACRRAAALATLASQDQAGEVRE